MQRCLGCMREFGEEFDVCPHCGYIVGTGAASKNYLEPGTVLQSRYTLGKVLGQGGFGITYIAWDNKIGKAVAVKEYMPNAFASRVPGEKSVSCYNTQALAEFRSGLEKTRRETRTLARFNELESVVKVYDCFEENDTAYIVMELLRGKTVKEILTERERLSFDETMRIMTPVLQTLD
ncbi:MAG: serine/threonine protein kinase, partial [Oscillospiraceae bacterium]|nr:serine/threonine protein kinase [Oscillospiraceae bacterium]